MSSMKKQSDLESLSPARLVRILVAAVPVAVFCYFVSGLGDKPVPVDLTMAEAIAARLQLVARVVVPQAAAAETPSSGTKTLLNGQAVYEGLCYGCHRDGIAGAPKFGDTKAWAPRIGQGFNTLVKHAIEGFTGKAGKMPPKGGGAYDDVEVARAVAYMANHAGASFPEPATLAKE